MKKTQEKHRKTDSSKKTYDLQTLLNSLADFIFIVDSNGNILHFNSLVSKRLGYTEEELLGKNATIVHPPELREEAASIISQMLKGQGDICPIPLLAKDGTLIPVETKVTRGRWNNQDVLFGICRDITERKLTEKALKESEEKFRNLAEQSPNMIFINKNRQVVYANKQCEEIMGYTRDEYYSPDFDFLTLIAPESIELVETGYRKHMEGEELESYEYSILTKQGTKLEAIITSKLINYDGGRAILGIVTDITKRKQAEQIILDKEKELENKAQNLEELNTALNVLLKKRDEDKTEVEEKVLLNIKQLVIPYLEKLKKSGLDETQTTYANIIESNLNDIISPLSYKLSSKHLSLSSTELKVVNLIKEGKTNKEISEVLNSSPRTIECHRDNIRKKLGIKNKKVNLKAYLSSIS